MQDPYKVLIPNENGVPGSALTRPMTCGFVNGWALSGGFTEAACQEMVEAGVAEMCDCQFTAEVIDTEIAPTAAPGDTNTVDDSTKPVAVSHTFSVRLSPVTGQYDESAKAGLEEACRSLLKDKITDFVVQAASCTVQEHRQSALVSNRRRGLRHHQHRALQNDAAEEKQMLDTVLVATLASFDEQVLSVEEGDMVAVFEDYRSELFFNLKSESGNEASQQYFGSVDAMQISSQAFLPPLPAGDDTTKDTDSPADGEEETESSNTDDDDDDDGLSDGAKAGIIIAVVIVVVLAAYLFWRKKTEEQLIAAPVEKSQDRSKPTTSIAEKSDTVPPPSTAPLAAAAKEKEEVVVDSTFSGDVSESDVSNEDSILYETVTVVAPPGKMGIQVDKKEEGLVIREVYEGSLLENEVFKGDIIVRLNKDDTRHMSSKHFKQLMVDTEDQERKIKIAREVDDSTHC